MLTAKYETEISDLRSELENEVSILIQLGKVLRESRQILNITAKVEPAGFLESLHLFSVKSSQKMKSESKKNKNDLNSKGWFWFQNSYFYFSISFEM